MRLNTANACMGIASFCPIRDILNPIKYIPVDTYRQTHNATPAMHNKYVPSILIIKSKESILVHSRPFGSALFFPAGFLDAISFLSCSGRRIGNHAIDAKWIRRVFFELHRALAVLYQLAAIHKKEKKKNNSKGIHTSSAAPRNPSFALPNTSNRLVFWILLISPCASSSSSTSTCACGR
jgi:hypothetical protein